jgi:hypothetical protein
MSGKPMILGCAFRSGTYRLLARSRSHRTLENLNADPYVVDGCAGCTDYRFHVAALSVLTKGAIAVLKCIICIVLGRCRSAAVFRLAAPSAC